jgi:hypothetical protein
LEKINLIVGATGAGKSALFNYLHDIPLIVSKKKRNNVEMNEPILLVDETKLKKMGKKFFAPIGCGFQSETSIPNFFFSRT